MTAKKLGISVPLLLSHCLYARLGFQTREPLSVVPRPALNIKSAKYDVRPAIEADIAACRRVHGFEHGVPPCGVVVSIHVSLRILKPAPCLAMAARTLSRSRVDLARRRGGMAANWLGAPTRTAIALRPKASQLYRFAPEITMPKVNLSRMTVEALMDLRKRVEEMLLEHRAKVQKQLEKMDAVVGGRKVVRGRGSVLKGRKVPPKYRGPSGETWAGRGAKPRWLVAAIKGGKKLDDFLINKARKGRRKRRSKR
jgi:DNA-binding protein H-NS